MFMQVEFAKIYNAVCLYINKTAIATLSTYFAVWHTTQRDFLLKLRHGECIVRIIKSKYTHLFFFSFFSSLQKQNEKFLHSYLFSVLDLYNFTGIAEFEIIWNSFVNHNELVQHILQCKLKHIQLYKVQKIQKSITMISIKFIFIDE